VTSRKAKLPSAAEALFMTTPKSAPVDMSVGPTPGRSQRVLT
jgi:hypothetical protein